VQPRLAETQRLALLFDGPAVSPADP